MNTDVSGRSPLHATITVDRDDPLSALAPEPFDGYPYLVQRIGRCPLRHMAVLPADWPHARLLHLARRQAEVNRLETYLCLSRSDVVHASVNGVVSLQDMVPTGLPVPERLLLVDPVPATEEVSARRLALAEYAKKLSPKGGALVGDGLEGGRPALPGEETRLAPCGTCGQQAGEFLALNGEGNLDMTQRIVQVHCKCENNNLCAGCGKPLAHKRLSAYYFDWRAGGVMYMAAYNAFGHHC